MYTVHLREMSRRKAEELEKAEITAANRMMV